MKNWKNWVGLFRFVFAIYMLVSMYLWGQDSIRAAERLYYDQASFYLLRGLFALAGAYVALFAKIRILE